MPDRRKLSPALISAIGRIGAETSWANTSDRAARTAPARKAQLDRFEKLVDPERSLPEEERRQRAAHARRAHYQRMAYLSARAKAGRR